MQRPDASLGSACDALRAEDMVTRMWRHLEYVRSERLRPDARMYAFVIGACAAAEQPSARNAFVAIKCLADMQARPLRPRAGPTRELHPHMPGKQAHQAPPAALIGRFTRSWWLGTQRRCICRTSSHARITKALRGSS